MKALTGLAKLALVALMVMAAGALADDKLPPWKGNAQGHGVESDVVGLIRVYFDGEATHLGRYTADVHHAFHGDFDFAGAATFTAANGDEIDVTYQGRLKSFDLPHTFAGKMKVRGGTGHFKDAVGEADFNGFEPNNDFFQFTFEGTLGNSDSDRLQRSR